MRAIRSSLRFSELEFKAYSEEQLLGIVRTRAERALAPGSYDERLLGKVVRSVGDGSARLALERLWKCAKRADKAERPKIMLQDLEDAIAQEPLFKLPELKLTAEEELIVELLREGELSSSDLYTRFLRGYRRRRGRYRNYIELLEKKGIVVSEDVEAEGMLKPRVLRLK